MLAQQYPYIMPDKIPTSEDKPSKKRCTLYFEVPAHTCTFDVPADMVDSIIGGVARLTIIDAAGNVRHVKEKVLKARMERI
jgi:hypothetical protein